MSKRAIQTLDVTLDANGNIMIAAADLASLLALVTAGVKIKNAAGTAINPATEDTLALAKAAVVPPTSIASSTKAGSAGGAQLVAVSTPCKGVWLGPPETAGVATNAAPVYVGGSDAQLIPVMPDNFEGIYVEIDNANKLYLKSATAESLRYAIFA